MCYNEPVGSICKETNSRVNLLAPQGLGSLYLHFTNRSKYIESRLVTMSLGLGLDISDCSLLAFGVVELDIVLND